MLRGALQQLCINPGLPGWRMPAGWLGYITIMILLHSVQQVWKGGDHAVSSPEQQTVTCAEVDCQLATNNAAKLRQCYCLL